MGASLSEGVLSAALVKMNGDVPEFPQDADEYLQAESEADLSEFDRAWGEEGYKEVIRCLEQYLSSHEAAFLEWVP